MWLHLGNFLNHSISNFFTKVAQIFGNFWPILKDHFLVKTVASTFRGAAFGNIWATFYCNIWSHCWVESLYNKERCRVLVSNNGQTGRACRGMAWSYAAFVIKWLRPKGLLYTKSIFHSDIFEFGDTWASSLIRMYLLTIHTILSDETKRRFK